jgi:hypothetical protein
MEGSISDFLADSEGTKGFCTEAFNGRKIRKHCNI